MEDALAGTELEKNIHQSPSRDEVWRQACDYTCRSEVGLSDGSGKLSKEAELHLRYRLYSSGEGTACEKAEQSFIQEFHWLSFKAKFDTSEWISVTIVEKIIMVGKYMKVSPGKTNK